MHQHDHACQHNAQQSADFSTNALISARQLKLTLGGRDIIDNVDIDVRAGEIVTLIGPNGAGKTTLVRALLGLEKLSGGEVRRHRSLKIGYAPQRFEVDRTLPVTVTRFLALGTDASGTAIKQALHEVGAAHVINQQLHRLSGGETQRVIIARALLRRPNLLVLDEPVRGVDYVGEAELYQLIAALRDKRGFGIILVSHDLHVVMAASDRVICLNHHVCCSGVPKAVASHPEYMRLFGPQAVRAFAIYEHHHDHTHDLAGRPRAAQSSTEDGK